LPVPAITAHAFDQRCCHHASAEHREHWRARARLKALLDLNSA
jgi:hypothetical protein